MAHEDPVFEALALSLYTWTDGSAPDWTFVHEIGHNLGCQHNRAAPPSPPDCEDNCDCIQGLCYFSWGYLLPPAEPLYDTLMSWEAPGGTEEILYFSNPDVLFRGFPTGEAPPSCDSADNAATIDVTRDTVANFRESCDTTDTTKIASHDYFEGQADGDSFSPAISDNGQYIAFASDATTGWLQLQHSQDEFSDIYLFNRESGLVKTVSSHNSGIGGDSFSPGVSGDGHFVTFASEAQNLFNVGPNQFGAADIYTWELFNGPVRRISVDSTGKHGNADSDSPSISRDGRFVAFASDATNLVGADGNLARDIFVRDRNGNENLIFDEPGDSSTARVSLTTAGGEANGGSYEPAISAEDGQFVVFESVADNLLATADTNGVRDIFVRDRLGESTFRVSISTAGVAGDAASFAPSISANGSIVVFESDATNLVSGDSNGVSDIFVRDTLSQITFRVSVSTAGDAGDLASFAPAISADGRFVAFHSDATNLLGEGVDTNGQSDVFVHDVTTGETVRVSINSLGEQSTGGPSSFPAISGDGRFIGFESDATNLVTDDANGFRDVFFRDRGSMCVGDFNGDFVVDAFDLAMLLGNWGPVPKCPPYVAYDLDFDCDVGAGDLAILLGNWGICL